jgi:hypothetical protein
MSNRFLYVDLRKEDLIPIAGRQLGIYFIN